MLGITLITLEIEVTLGARCFPTLAVIARTQVIENQPHEQDDEPIRSSKVRFGSLGGPGSESQLDPGINYGPLYHTLLLPGIKVAIPGQVAYHHRLKLF